MFDSMRNQVLAKMECLSEQVGYDGKVIESNSTNRGNPRIAEASQAPSDSDAS